MCMKCTNCSTDKDASCFYKNKVKKDGLCGLCKDCVKIKRTLQGFESPERNTWKNMHARVKRPLGRNRWYENIHIDERWYKYKNFLEDMGKRPTGLTLDRIDSRLGYSKENCRWATPKEQANNRRNSRRVKYQGKVMTLQDLSTILGISVRTVWSKVNSGQFGGFTSK